MTSFPAYTVRASWRASPKRWAWLPAIAVVAVLVALIVGPRGASASSPLVAAPCEFSGEISEHHRERLRQALHEGMARSGRPVDVADPGDPIGRRLSVCADKRCRQAVMGGRPLAHIIVAQVAFDGADYRIVVAAFSAASGEARARSEDLCELCGIDEAARMLADESAAVVASIDPPHDVRGRIIVETAPKGAAVVVDGVRRGIAPVELEVDSGPHKLVVSKRGYETSARDVFADAGIVERFHVSLNPSRSNRLIPWGAATLTVGLMSAAGGSVLLVLHGRPRSRGCEPDLLGQCPTLHDTQAGGIAMAAAGGVAVIAGATVLIVGLLRRRAKGRLVLRPLGLGVLGQF